LGVAYASIACSRTPDEGDALACIDLASLPECSSGGWCSVDSLIAEAVDASPDYMRPAVHGLADDDVWIGIGHALSEVDLTGLLPPPGKTSLLTGTARDDVWAVVNALPSGDARFHFQLSLVHFDGSAWSLRPAPPVEAIDALAAVSRDELWASTPRGFFHFDGSAWTEIAWPSSDFPAFRQPMAISGNGPDDVWLGQKYHWNGVRVDGAPLAEDPPTLAAEASGLFRSGGHLWATTGNGSIRVRGLP
jgi:hypothetical protein